MKNETYSLILKAFDNEPVVKLELVAKKYLPPCKTAELRRKARYCKLPFPVAIHGEGRATSYLVHLKHVAKWLDTAASEAEKDFAAMNC